MPCRAVAGMPALPTHEIDAGLWRRNRERRHGHWPGAWPAGTDFAKTVCTYRWQNAFSLVRKVLRDERGRRPLEDLFRGSLPVFSRKKFQRHGSRSCPGRDSQLLVVDA